MFNDSLLLLPFSQLKDVLANDMSLFDIALIYTLFYVVYKALGRYIYFKPEEHASKINRTFLFLSLYIVIVHFFTEKILDDFLIPVQYKWLYVLCALVIISAFLSLISDRIIRNYKLNNGTRDWVHYFLPIQKDSYRSTTRRSEVRGNYSSDWNEEVIEYTELNLHSDMMLNFMALFIFCITNVIWISNIIAMHEYLLVTFMSVSALTVAIIFIDQGLFKWMYFLRKKYPK